jgi:Na+/H+ antiporter NhaD/arsenite permease-like protein
MSIELLGVIVLLLIFIIGAILPINMGILGFVAALIVGSLISGMSIDDIFSVFPADLFVLLAGVTYLFAIVYNNGTIDLITTWGLRLVKGNLGLIPWVIFILSALLSGIGTSAIAVVSILAPIALRLAVQYKINPILMGVLVVIGATGGAFSPLNLFGLIVMGVMESRNLPHSPELLFVNTFIYCLVIAIIVFLVFGGTRMLRRRDAAQTYVATTVEVIDNIEDSKEIQENRLTLYKGVTIASIFLLIVLVLGFKANIGFTAFALGLALSLMAPKQQSEIIKQMPWGVILMISGVVTYVGVLEKIGTIEYMTELVASVGNPVIASLVASYIGGIISAFASTTGFLAAIIPLATPILKDPTVSSVGVISAISISSSIVDLSPFSTNGALLLANVKGMSEREFFRKLLFIAALFVILGPGLAWLFFVLIGTPW